MERLHIVSVTMSDDTLAVDLEDGRTIAVPIGWYPRLAYATPAERANFRVKCALFDVVFSAQPVVFLPTGAR